MVKRILIAAVSAIVALVILFFVFIKSTGVERSVAIIEAVPRDAIVLMDKLDYSHLVEMKETRSHPWTAVVSLLLNTRTDSLLEQISQEVSSLPVLRETLSDKGLSISLHLQGNKSLIPIFYIPATEELSPLVLFNELTSGYGDSIAITTRKYEAVEVQDVSVQMKDRIVSLSYTHYGGLIIASPSQLMLESSIRTLHSGGGIVEFKGFQKVAATSGKYVSGNIYVNYASLEAVKELIVQPVSGGANLFKGALADWGAFDLDLEEGAFMLNGMTSTSDSLPGWLNMLKGQSSVKLESHGYIPASVALALTVGIEDAEQFHKSFLQELKLRGSDQFFLSHESNMEKLIGTRPFTTLLDLMRDEISYVIMYDNMRGRYESLTVMEAKSGSASLETLKSWVAALAAQSGQEPERFEERYELDDQTHYTIYRFPTPIFKEGVMAGLVMKYFAVHDNLVFFSNSSAIIKNAIYQNILKKTIENSPGYDQTSEMISSRINLLIYADPSRILDFHREQLTPGIEVRMKERSGELTRIPAMILQYASEEDVFFANLGVHYARSVKKQAHTVWESLMDTTLLTKPVMVKNHYTNENEIIVQDAANTLYLINSTGRVLWRVPLPSEILGEIFQVDYYQNGKLQYLFNTREGIHLLDRNGNPVERYPIKLRSGATNGIALFDYDNTGDYRIFVACENRRVYLYDIEGNIIPGWTFKKTETLVKKPIQHFRVKDKDYILISDRQRSYVLDRRGDERTVLERQFPPSENNSYYLSNDLNGDTFFFTTTDSLGQVFSIALDGKVEMKLEHEAPSDHYFIQADLNNDGKDEYIFAADNTTTILSESGKRIASYKVKGTIAAMPDMYTFSANDRKIGIVDRSKNQIHLINSDGSLYEGFPLEGNTRFSIGYFAGSDSRFNLIVGSSSGFLYNYSIE